jgi:hypothetical protein
VSNFGHDPDVTKVSREFPQSLKEHPGTAYGTLSSEPSPVHLVSFYPALYGLDRESLP